MSGASIWTPDGILAADGRYLRVPIGETVPALGDAAARANKLLGFDVGGNPVLTSPAGSDLELRLANAGNPDQGANLVGMTAGLAYDPNTVGAYINQLLNTSMEPFGINVMEYIPVAERAAIKNFTSTYDAHTSLQNAINAAANVFTRKLFWPAGRYRIPENKTLRNYYDAVNNPGYPNLRNAHMEHIGEGIDSEASGSGVPGNLCGTLLWSDPATPRTVPIYEASPASLDALPYFGRDFVMRDMSFDANMVGHLVVCRGVPGARFINTQIHQRNAAGSGLYISTFYFGAVDGCRFNNYGVGAKTGDAITVNSTIASGLFEFTNRLNVQNFGHGVRFVGGDFQNVTFYGPELSGAIGGLTVETAARIQNLTMISPYFEGTLQYWIKDNGASGERIGQLNITGGFGFGAGLSQAAIQLNKPQAVDIRGMQIQDLAGTFMNIAAQPSLGHAAYNVSNMSFVYPSGISGLRTLFTGVLPAFREIEYPEGNPNCRLHALGATPIRTDPLFATDSSRIRAGHLIETSIVEQSPAVGGTTYFHAAQGFPAKAVLGTSTGTVIYEVKKGSTANLGNGFTLKVYNRGGGTVEIRLESLGTLIASIPANTSKEIEWNTLFDAWLV